MRRSRTIVRALFGATIAAGGVVVLAPAAQAITIPVACSENALVAAVNLANSTPTSDTLVLAGGCTYGMTTGHGGAANALPVITTPIEMIGPATVTNASLLGLGLFRIAEVGATGSLTLTTGVAFTRGNVVGDGGGILNRGAVTLTGSTLTGNTASGNGGGLANADTPTGTAPAATFTNSPLSGNTTLLGDGGAIYNGLRGTLTGTGVSGSPLFVTGAAGRSTSPRVSSGCSRSSVGPPMSAGPNPNVWSASSRRPTGPRPPDGQPAGAVTDSQPRVTASRQ